MGKRAYGRSQSRNGKDGDGQTNSGFRRLRVTSLMGCGFSSHSSVTPAHENDTIEKSDEVASTAKEPHGPGGLANGTSGSLASHAPLPSESLGKHKEPSHVSAQSVSAVPGSKDWPPELYAHGSDAGDPLKERRPSQETMALSRDSGDEIPGLKIPEQRDRKSSGPDRSTQEEDSSAHGTGRSSARSTVSRRVRRLMRNERGGRRPSGLKIPSPRAIGDIRRPPATVSRMAGVYDMPVFSHRRRLGFDFIEKGAGPSDSKRSVNPPVAPPPSPLPAGFGPSLASTEETSCADSSKLLAHASREGPSDHAERGIGVDRGTGLSSTCLVGQQLLAIADPQWIHRSLSSNAILQQTSMPLFSFELEDEPDAPNGIKAAVMQSRRLSIAGTGAGSRLRLGSANMPSLSPAGTALDLAAAAEPIRSTAAKYQHRKGGGRFSFDAQDREKARGGGGGGHKRKERGSSEGVLSAAAAAATAASSRRATSMGARSAGVSRWEPSSLGQDTPGQLGAPCSASAGSAVSVPPRQTTMPFRRVPNEGAPVVTMTTVHVDRSKSVEGPSSEDLGSDEDTLVPPPGRLPSFRQSTKAEEQSDGSGHRIVNQYVLQEGIGRGAYGDVYRCQSQTDGCTYAMKILHRSILKRKRVGRFGNALESVKREVAVWKMLNHPHVVRLVEVIDDPSHDKIYMVSEYVDGGSVMPDVAHATPVALETARHYFAQLVEALSYLHFHKVIHRDIKPGNLVVDSATGTLKVVDFGVAQMYEGEDDKILSTAGTAAFMAPEMFTGSVFSGRKVDVWAAGISLFMMLTGRPAFSGKMLHQIADKIQEEDVTFPADGSVPEDAQQIIWDMLTKDPELRPTVDKLRTYRFLRCPPSGRPLLSLAPSHRRLMPSQGDVNAAISPLLTFKSIVRAKRFSVMMLSKARKRLANRVHVVGVLRSAEKRATGRQGMAAGGGSETDDESESSPSPMAKPPAAKTMCENGPACGRSNLPGAVLGKAGSSSPTSGSPPSSHPQGVSSEEDHTQGVSMGDMDDGTDRPTRERNRDFAGIGGSHVL